MTRLIAHRGNFDGINRKAENTMPYLLRAVDAGYDVEVDVWYVDHKWFFGHDGPQYEVFLSDILLLSESAWFHIKNYEAAVELSKFRVHMFSHNNDPFVLTNRGIIWSHGGVKNHAGVACMPLINEKYILLSAWGICADDFTEIITVLAAKDSE